MLDLDNINPGSKEAQGKRLPGKSQSNRSLKGLDAFYGERESHTQSKGQHDHAIAANPLVSQDEADIDLGTMARPTSRSTHTDSPAPPTTATHHAPQGTVAASLAGVRGGKTMSASELMDAAFQRAVSQRRQQDTADSSPWSEHPSFSSAEPQDHAATAWHADPGEEQMEWAGRGSSQVYP